MTDFDSDGRPGLLWLAVLIIAAAVLGLFLAERITAHNADAQAAQVAIERERVQQERVQQQGQTDRTEIFALTLAGIVAMAKQDGTAQLLVIVVAAGVVLWVLRSKA